MNLSRSFAAKSLLILCLLLFPAAGYAAKVGPLVATDFPDLHAAVDELRKTGGSLYIPTGYYTVTETINLSGLGYSKGIRIYGDGRGSVIVGDTKGKPIIDLTATGMLSVEQLRISSKSANIGILHGRSGGGSAGCCNYSFLFMDGEYSLACIYNLGSEVNRHFNCMFWNHAKGGHGYIFTGKNYFNAESPFQKLDQSACNTDLSFYGCFWGVYGGTGKEVNLYLAGPVTADVCVYGGDMSNKNGGRAAVLLDGRGTHLLSIRIQGVRFETQGARHCVEAVDGYMPDVQIRENMMLSEEECIYAVGPGRKENWTISDNMLESWKQADWGQQTGRSAIRIGFLSNSTINATSGRLDRSRAPGGADSAGAPTASTETRRFARMSIVVENESTGNHFTVRKSEDIRLPAATAATRVSVLNDGPYGREYFHGAGVGTPVLLNLAPCDSQAIPAPKKGDVVLDSGKNTPDGKPTLAIFDGERWRYLRTFE
ncbi:MAG: hypothetical protein ACYC7E_15935 [Armatimonadota bacterium]